MSILVSLLIALVVLAILFAIFRAVLPMLGLPEPWPGIINLILLLVALIVILDWLGVLGGTGLGIVGCGHPLLR